MLLLRALAVRPPVQLVFQPSFRCVRKLFSARRWVINVDIALAQQQACPANAEAVTRAALSPTTLPNGKYGSRFRCGGIETSKKHATSHLRIVIRLVPTPSR